MVGLSETSGPWSTSVILMLGPGEEHRETLLYLEELYRNIDFLFINLTFLTWNGLLLFSFGAHKISVFLRSNFD